MLLVSGINTVILLCYEILHLFSSCGSDVFPADSEVCLGNVCIFEIYKANTQSPVLTPTAREMHIKDLFLDLTILETLC